MPKGTLDQIDSIRRKFFWRELGGNSSSTRKLHTINWRTICLPKDRGGLGLSNLEHRNWALITKWWWKFQLEKSSLWRKVIAGKYGVDCLYTLRDKWSQGKPTKISPILQSIISIPEDSFEKCCNKKNFIWKLNNGKLIDFWIDNWHSKGVLRDVFPKLFNILIKKDIKVNQMVEFWNLALSVKMWKRTLKQDELEELFRLDELIKEIFLTDRPDKLVWKESNNQFSTSISYSLISESSSIDSYWGFIWKLKIPGRIKVFLWQCSHKKISTLSLLKSRGILSNDLCKWCGQHREDFDHLFWSCSLANQVWEIISEWLEVDLSSLQQMELKACLTILSSNHFRIGGGICFAAALWSIWLERNANMFRGYKIKHSNLKFIVKHRAYIWSLAANLIPKNQENIWAIYPKQAFCLKKNWDLRNLKSYWFSISDYLGFVDGSWTHIQNGQYTAGIGGFLVNKTGSAVLVFSGPTNQTSSLESEKEALRFLIKEIVKKNLDFSHITIFSDSRPTIEYINNSNFGKSLDIFSPEDNLVISKCFFEHISRELNQVADNLAKEGAKRLVQILGWKI